MIKLSSYDLELLTPDALGQILCDILDVKTLTQDDLAYAALVIEIGAEVNFKDNAGYSPLHLAARYGHLEIVKILLQAGAKLDILDKFGWSPLHKAAYREHLEIVKILLQAGADPDIQNNHGWSTLYRAAYHGQLEIVKILIEAGVDINLKNEDGETAWDYATQAIKAACPELEPTS